MRHREVAAAATAAVMMVVTPMMEMCEKDLVALVNDGGTGKKKS